MVVENNSDFTKERLLFTSQAVLIIKSLKPNKKFTNKEKRESKKKKKIDSRYMSSKTLVFLGFSN